MNVCKVPDMCKDMEYKYITEDSKTSVSMWRTWITIRLLRKRMQQVSYF